MLRMQFIVFILTILLFCTVHSSAMAQEVSETPTPTTAINQPVCNNLTVDKQTTGVAPLALNFTANGSASDSAISKATFTFGDGQTLDATDSASVGSPSANVSAAHTYTTPGTYQASVIFTDSNGVTGVVTSTCTQNITVTAPASTPTITVAPTMPVTGSSAITVGVGLAALAFIIGGTLLVFVL